VFRIKLIAVRALCLALIALAAVGAGWKWQHPPKNGQGVVRLPGWTWDEQSPEDSGSGADCNGNSCDGPGPQA
jgi:hypothetical protein